MKPEDKVVMRLVGELRWRGTDWNLEEYRSLFERLGNVAEAGIVTRLVRYYGMASGDIKVRFLGIVSDIRKIPDGMIALELSDDSITVRKPGDKKPWGANLKWDWLDRSNPKAPVGDFTTRVPDSWDLPAQGEDIAFVLTANSYFMKDKSADDDVRLAEYDADWPVQYEAMAAWLRENIPPEILLRVEHFGSTAVPGMPAKPVIDIIMEVPSFRVARRNLIPVFNQPECEYWGYDDHILFILRKEFMGTRTHHIHAAPAGMFWERIAFCDYLRTHPDDAKRYAALKHELAGRHATDREAYTDAKELFVKEITKKALKDKHQ